MSDLKRMVIGVPTPESFTSRVRGPRLTSRVGLALAVTFGVCFLTGVWSHLQYDPPAWAPIGPSPASLYRVTQGAHVVFGLASIPLVLLKLWSVYPRLFVRPPLRPARHAVLHGLERASVGVLVASAIFLLVSGTLNILQWYPWSFSFRRTHEAVSWLVVGSILIHVAVKLTLIRESLDGHIDEDREPALDPDDTGPARRTVLRAGFLGSAAVVAVTAGQSVPPLRALTLPWLRDGDGPQGLAVNRTASDAGVDPAATGAAFALEITFADRVVRLSRDDLAALPQHAEELPIACVEGWSRSATWTGVRVRDLLALVDARADSEVAVTSLQTRRAFGTSVLPPQFAADERTLLALRLNGEELSLDHGYPCRLIAPNRPGVLQTKWVSGLEVRA